MKSCWEETHHLKGRKPAHEPVLVHLGLTYASSYRPRSIEDVFRQTVLCVSHHTSHMTCIAYGSGLSSHLTWVCLAALYLLEWPDGSQNPFDAVIVCSEFVVYLYVWLNMPIRLWVIAVMLQLCCEHLIMSVVLTGSGLNHVSFVSLYL